MSTFYTNVTDDDFVEAENREHVMGIGAYDRRFVAINQDGTIRSSRAGALYAEARRGGNAMRQAMWAANHAVHADEVYKTFSSFISETGRGCPEGWYRA